MPKKKATKQDWIILGYNLFSKEGITGIIVEKMARTLKVNKSGFYWYFKSKKLFIQEIIDYWIHIDTNRIISELESQELGVLEKMEKLIELAFKKEANLDFIFFLKRYSTREKLLKIIIDNIDNQRIAYTSKILQEMGYQKKDATIKAGLFYKYMIGYHEMIRYKDQSNDYKNEVIQELSQFINFKKC